MKRLWLVRHAKSSWRNSTLSDRERPLNRRGELNAPQMGRRLARGGDIPQLIVTSPAVRALTTARILAEELHIRRKRLIVDERLYHASRTRLLRVLRELDDRYEHVMLVGHNPELTELCRSWAPQIAHLPTCAVVRLDFKLPQWRELDHAEVSSVTFDHPKNSRDRDPGYSLRATFE